MEFDEFDNYILNVIKKEKLEPVDIVFIQHIYKNKMIDREILYECAKKHNKLQYLKI